MDSHEWNKIIGGILATVLFVLAVHIVSQAIYAAPEPEKPTVAIATGAPPPASAPAPAAAGAAAPAAPAAPAAEAPAAPPADTLPDFATAIPAADAMTGETVAERCMVCHDIMKGGTNKIGPFLYGVIGRAKASMAGFEYSQAMKDKGGNWTYGDLFQFIRQPAMYVPGTKMGFAGLPRAQDRLNLIAYLRTQADAPAPLP